MPRSFRPRVVALLLIPVLAAALTGCRERAEGSVKVVVIGGSFKLQDPAAGPLDAPSAVLLQNVAQGLVAFDAGGNIVGGLAERWNVSDDGLSYIFRIASGQWPDGRKISAQQLARLLKRQIFGRTRNSLKDSLGAVEDVVAMTDRVIEIRLGAPRPSLLSLLAQPEMAILRDNLGTGPFRLTGSRRAGSGLTLRRDIISGVDEVSHREEVLLSAASARVAVADFVADQSDLVLGGNFADLRFAQQTRLPRGSLRFDPASGLFGLVPVRSGGAFDDPNIRRMLSAAIDREAMIAAFAVPGLAARATLLEPALDGAIVPVAPLWASAPIAERRRQLQAEAKRRLGRIKDRTVRVALPQGPGADLLFAALARDWGVLGLTVERAASQARADFVLIDEVAPSASPAWFARRFRCGMVAVCDKEVDQLLEGARLSVVPAQRYTLLAQAAGRIDNLTLFISITAPVRWALVGRRIDGFAGNRYARHTLTDLERNSGSGD